MLQKYDNRNFIIFVATVFYSLLRNRSLYRKIQNRINRRTNIKPNSYRFCSSVRQLDARQKLKLADTRRHSAVPLCRGVADKYRTASESVTFVALVMARATIGNISVSTRNSCVRHLDSARSRHIKAGRMGDFRQCRTDYRP